MQEPFEEDEIGNREAAGGMVRIDIADLERELRAALAGRAGELRTTSGTASGSSSAGRNHDAPGARRLRLVEQADRLAGLER